MKILAKYISILDIKDDWHFLDYEDMQFYACSRYRYEDNFRYFEYRCDILCKDGEECNMKIFNFN